MVNNLLVSALAAASTCLCNHVSCVSPLCHQGPWGGCLRWSVRSVFIEPCPQRYCEKCGRLPSTASCKAGYVQRLTSYALHTPCMGVAGVHIASCKCQTHVNIPCCAAGPRMMPAHVRTVHQQARSACVVLCSVKASCALTLCTPRLRDNCATARKELLPCDVHRCWCCWVCGVVVRRSSSVPNVLSGSRRAAFVVLWLVSPSRSKCVSAAGNWLRRNNTNNHFG